MAIDAQILTTLRCTLSCPRCVNRNVVSSKPLDWDVFKAFVESAQLHGIRYSNLYFTGGEPTLWPCLKEAITLVKQSGMADRVIVRSNGVGRSYADYFDADVIHITDYGAINRLDIDRIRRTARCKVVISHPTHLDWPFPKDQSTLPAKCTCHNETLFENCIYPCVFMAMARGGQKGVSPLSNWRKAFESFTFDQPECSYCLANDVLAEKYRLHTAIECFAWDKIGRAQV